MKKKITLLILFTTFSTIYAQAVHLGKVHIGKVALGTTGTSPPPPLTDSIGAEWWDSTGYPIGGGPGYADSIQISSGNGTTHYYVSTFAHFKAVIEDSITKHDTLYIADDAIIDFGSTQYVIYGTALSGRSDSILICSGRGRTLGDTISWGGTLYTGDLTNDELLRVYGTNIRFSGLRFKGNVRHYYCANPMPYPTLALLSFWWGANHQVDNCEFFNAGYAGIVANNSVNIRNCYFHHNKARGCGYGVVLDGSPTVNIDACLFDFYRHAIAAGVATTGSYNASYNICMEHATEYQSFDQHIGLAGDIHNISWHAYQETGNEVGGFGMQSGAAADSLKFYNIWSCHPDSAETFGFSSTANVRISDMQYGTSMPDGLSDRIPTADGQVDVDSGQIPLKITMKDEASSDPDGTIKWYEWDLGIGDVENRVRAESTQYTYTKVGQYHPRFYVYDNYGIPDYDDFTIKAVPVTAKQDSFWLTFNYLDSYAGTALSNYLQAQVLIDNDTVWLQDVVGDSEWQHTALNVTSEVGASDSVTLELRLVYKHDFDGSLADMHVFFDDIWGWNLTIRNGDFETEANGTNQAPDYWTAGHVSAGGGYVGWYQFMGEVTSGKMSLLMKTTEGSYGQTNDYVYCRQEIDVVGQ